MSGILLYGAADTDLVPRKSQCCYRDDANRGLQSGIAAGRHVGCVTNTAQAQ